MKIFKEKIVSLLIFINLLFVPVTKLIAYTKRSNSLNKETVESISKAPLILEQLNFDNIFGQICYSHSSHVSHSSHASHVSHASHSSGSHYSRSSESESDLGVPSDLSSTNIATYIQNNNFRLSDPTLTNLIYSKKSSYIDNIIDINSSSLKLGLNANFSINNNFLSLPIEVLFKKTIVSFELPYFINRLIKDDNSLKENSGFGDGLLSYGLTLEDYFANEHTIDLYLKIPLGEYKNSLINKLTALGSGSTDFIFDYHFFGDLENSHFEGQIFYRFNDYSTQEYDEIEFKIKDGNILFFGGRYDYYLNKKITLSTFMNSIISGQGKTKESSTIEVTNNQNLFLVDFSPQISYKIYDFDLILNINFPFLTVWTQDDSRKTVISFKINGDIFNLK